MYHPIQKYKFESKSQRSSGLSKNISRCITQYKNTNLKANHNSLWRHTATALGVSPNTKIQIWKQITTAALLERHGYRVYHPIQKYKFESKSQRSFRERYRHRRVYHPIQKYKFESKSQLTITGTLPQMGCITQYKNTNLKANHNDNGRDYPYQAGVSPNTKIQIWKQITTAFKLS